MCYVGFRQAKLSGRSAGISEAQAHCATAMQAIAKKREDCELQYLLSRSVRNSRAAALCLLRSFALRSSASLHPAQRALGSVMSQVKRCAQSGSSPRVLVIPKMQAKQKTMHCMVICFVGFRRLPTLPDRRQSSTIGV